MEKSFISGAELDKARTLLDGTREAVKTAEAQIKVERGAGAQRAATVKQRERRCVQRRRSTCERTIIRAPVDGTVISRQVDAGQTVAASLQAPVLFTIAQDLRDMQVEAAIDEADVGSSASASAPPSPSTLLRPQLRRRDPADPQGRAERAERRQLHGVIFADTRIRRCCCARHDRERARRGGQPRERAQGAERGAALASAGRRRAEGRSGARPRAAAGRQRRGDTRPGAQARRELKLDARRRRNWTRSSPSCAEVGGSCASCREADRRKRRRAAARRRARRDQRDAQAEPQKPTRTIVAGETGARAPAEHRGRVYVPGPDGKPAAVDVRTGLTDGTSDRGLGGAAARKATR